MTRLALRAFFLRLVDRFFPAPAKPYDNAGQHWIQSYTGIAVEPFDLKPEQISILDIAHALSNVCRYTGHTREFYSVATHSIAVMRLAQVLGHGVEMQLWALLHDAGEAYMADVAAPLKRHPVFTEYRKLEAEIDTRLRRRFNIGLEDSQLTLIRTFDMAMLTPERAALMVDPPRDWGTFPIIPEAADALEWARAETVGAFPEFRAEEAFLKHFARLNGARFQP